MLVEENGVAVDRHKLIRKLKPARTRALLLVHWHASATPRAAAATSIGQSIIRKLDSNCPWASSSQKASPGIRIGAVAAWGSTDELRLAAAQHFLLCKPRNSFRLRSETMMLSELAGPFVRQASLTGDEKVIWSDAPTFVVPGITWPFVDLIEATG
jgi:hypothetical protein